MAGPVRAWMENNLHWAKLVLSDGKLEVGLTLFEHVLLIDL